MGTEYISKDFQCPDTGFGVMLTWNDSTGLLLAAVCDTGVWEHEPESADAISTSQNWCDAFNRRQKKFESLDEANGFVDQYDTYF